MRTSEQRWLDRTYYATLGFVALITLVVDGVAAWLIWGPRS